MPRGIYDRSALKLKDNAVPIDEAHMSGDDLSCLCKAQRIQVHLGVQVGAKVHTGFDVDHLAKQEKITVDMSVCRLGVIVRLAGKMAKLIPFSNIKDLELIDV